MLSGMAVAGRTIPLRIGVRRGTVKPGSRRSTRGGVVVASEVGVHVLHVVRTLGHGGMERNLRRVAMALSHRAIRSSILLLHDRQDVISFPDEIPIHRVVTRPHDPRMALRIASLLRRVRPTVIHARNWGAWPDTAIARLLVHPRPPLIFSYHGMEGSSVPRALRWKFKAMEKITTRMFAVSEAARDLLVEAYGLSKKRVDVIQNGVDTELFTARPPRSSAGRFVIGSVGRMFRVKNLPLLLRAAHRLISSGLDVELCIAGDGPDEALVRELGASLGLSDRLVLLGHVEDVVSVMHRLDLFVLSSENEANPNALLEAMSCALPCVSTAVGSVPELLDGGRCGLLVRPGDEIALADGMRRIIEDHGFREALGRAARRRVCERYSQARMFDAYEALYRSPSPLEP